IIASDVSLLVTFNHAIDGVIQNNPKARTNPKALAQLDGYKRPLVNSLSGNLQRFGMERVAKVESLQEIIAEMSETGDKAPQNTHNRQLSWTCDNDRMARKTRGSTRKTTEWNLGQPLAFPAKTKPFRV